MFLEFFSNLREAQIPVTLREYLSLMEAIDHALVVLEPLTEGAMA